MRWPFRSRPAKPKPRSVLLDAGFIGALIATDAPPHEAACRLYATLVDRYAAGLDRLFALSGVLGDLPREFRRNALAPVVTVRVARQHRSAARRIADRSTDAALSLVMMRRDRIRTVATTGREFDDVNVTVLFADEPLDMASLDLDAVALDAGALDREAAELEASIRSGTAPTPAPQSTDG